LSTPEAESRERIRLLEREVTGLREANAVLATNIEHLTKAVEALAVTVQSLRDTVNRGQGAVSGMRWLWMTITGAIGAVLGVLGSRLLGS